MSISTLPLIPILFLLPGLSFLAGRSVAPTLAWPRGRIGLADLLVLSIALVGWTTQTLALAGYFTVQAITASVILLSLALLFRHGPHTALQGIRRVRLTACRPAVPALLAALAVILLAALIYRPPGVGLLGGPPAPAFYGLGMQLAGTGSLPVPHQAFGLAWATEAMRSAAGTGLFFPAWIGQLHLLGGSTLSSAAPVLFVSLSLLTIFRLGRQATGSAMFGAVLLVALGLNYPQVWLARVTVPEAAAQFLVLASALFFLRSRDGFPGIPAAALTLGAATLCTPGLLDLTGLALLLLLALHAGAPAADRRLAALYSLGVLPFLAQGWVQAILLGHCPGPVPPLPACLAAVALLVTALAFLRPPTIAGKALPLPLFCWTLLIGTWAVRIFCSRAEAQLIPGGSSHWMIWYVTLPFAVLMAGGLLEMLISPGNSLRFMSRLGPLFTLALVSATLILHNPGPTVTQPWASRPFTVTVIPVTLMVGLLFYRRMLGRLRHPLLRVIWCSFLAVLLGLNLANLMPMATGKPGHGAESLVRQVAAPLTGHQRPFTAVVEPGPAALGLHIALEGAFGIQATALNGAPRDRDAFHRLVRENAAAGRRTALVISEGSFIPDPGEVQLRTMATVDGELRRFYLETEHLPSSVVAHRQRMMLFEVIPVPEHSDAPGLITPGRMIPLTIRAGIYAEDWPFLASGFRGTTAVGGRSFRWTAKRSTIRLPDWAESVELTVGGHRPPGAPSTSITAGFAGYPPQVQRLLPRQGFVTISIIRPAGVISPALIELRSTVFRPGPWFTESDRQPRGLQLSAITFHQAAATTSRFEAGQ